MSLEKKAYAANFSINKNQDGKSRYKYLPEYLSYLKDNPSKN